MGKGRKKTEKKYSVDAMMLNVTSLLVRDFQRNLNDPSFCSNFQAEIRSGNIARIREVTPAPDDVMDVAKFKATYQIQSVLKRYRFRKDTYSDEELTEKAISTFRETQTRLASLHLYKLPANSQLVLDVAARYVARVLGTYDDEECRDLCRFGSGASVGVPARLACEAARWHPPISGSFGQIEWFDSEMSQIDCVQEYLDSVKSSDASGNQVPTYHPTSSLQLSLVPKTFKSLRAIMPNTTVGSYMSDGIGKVIRKRLKREGYDIGTLQMRHRVLAQQASEHGMLVTADLSSASDSISVQLVDRLFPADWCEILHQSRIRQVDLPDGTSVESLTFCTMGIGYTFPLQTLVFLALLKAIQAVHFGRLDRRTISVYGDDLIYATRMHEMVVHYFQQFGFVINLDKTFHEGKFRESCGGDYYHGVDVRPFQPRNGAASVGQRTYEAILYKYANTLLARWSEYEIGSTLDYLMSEIQHVARKVKIVPCNYPDDSGVKCPTLTHWNFLRRAQTSSLQSMGNGVFRFSFLRLVPEERKETRHGPYLWLGLRGGYSQILYGSDHIHHELPGPLVTWFHMVAGVQEDCRTLKQRDDKPIKTFRGISGRRLRRSSTYVTVSNTGRYMRQSGFSCFEDRRPFA